MRGTLPFLALPRLCSTKTAVVSWGRGHSSPAARHLLVGVARLCRLVSSGCGDLCRCIQEMMQPCLFYLHAHLFGSAVPCSCRSSEPRSARPNSPRRTPTASAGSCESNNAPCYRHPLPPIASYRQPTPTNANQRQPTQSSATHRAARAPKQLAVLCLWLRFHGAACMTFSIMSFRRRCCDPQRGQGGDRRRVVGRRRRGGGGGGGRPDLLDQTLVYGGPGALVQCPCAMPLRNDLAQCPCAMPLCNALAQCPCAMPLCNALVLQ